MLSLPVQEQFRQFIKSHLNLFCQQINYPKQIDINRITVWADVDMFKKKEDAFVWGQDKFQDHVYSVFFDGQHICYLTTHKGHKQTLADFWKGFLKLYSLPDTDANKIWIDKEIYDIKLKEAKEARKKQDKQILDAIKAKPVKTETQAIAKEIAIDATTRPNTTTK